MINKKLFEISKEEKNRILGLHENATKKQYLIKEEQNDDYLYFAVVPARERYANILPYIQGGGEVYYAARSNSNGQYYRATPSSETDERGLPLKFNVITSSRLPNYSQNSPEKSELFFTVTRTEDGRLNFNSDAYDMVKNAKLGSKEPQAQYGKQELQVLGAGDRFMVFSLDDQSVRIVNINILGGAEFDNFIGDKEPIDFKNLKVGEPEVFNVAAEYIYSQGKRNRITNIGASDEVSIGGYPIPQGKTPPSTPQIDVAKLKIDLAGKEPFEFDSTKLAQGGIESLNNLINKIKENQEYLNFIKKQPEIQVYAYSSKDGDEKVNVPAKNGCPASSRGNYDLCLSQKRADFIASEINKALGTSNFKGYGQGYKNSIVPNWEPNAQTKFKDTLPNRRFEVKLPTFQTQVKK